MDFELKPVAGRLRLSVAEDVIFVVAPDEQPACPLLPLLHKLQTFKGARPPVYHIAGYNHPIGLPRFEVGRYGLQPNQIGVNVG